MAIKEPKVGSRYHYPDDNMDVIVEEVLEEGTVAAQALDANGEKFGAVFVVDPDELEDVRPASSGRPSSTMLRMAAGRLPRRPPTDTPEDPFVPDVAPRIELTDGLRAHLGSRLHEGGSALRTVISVDVVGGRTVLIVEQWDIEGEPEPKRHLISEAGELQL